MVNYLEMSRIRRDLINIYLDEFIEVCRDCDNLSVPFVHEPNISLFLFLKWFQEYNGQGNIYSTNHAVYV